ncbi:hypothetical protein FJT64_004292 [Amphibalanus amphitrite]|uniref:HTH psq-type domain-containing protein n=1 Tax=Amphibalanus amphitrite TaxID=1232801 RepID=A0A6A4VU55_AMPAM|nr:hypothetical protein FJT64_004292 [Amphibalanus amphitrite]
MAPSLLSTAASYINNYINYAPTPMRPEWKRYKQYSKSDLQQALDAVRGGLTALQASRKFHVPSRTLYDKIKKLGIPTMPRRYPRSVTAVPPSQVPAFPTPPPPPAAEDDSSQQSGGHRTNGSSGGGGEAEGQRQPMELTVPRRRPSGGAEREVGEDGLKRDAAGLCAAQLTNGPPGMPGLRPMTGVTPAVFPPPGDEEDRRRANGDASGMQRQPMELVVGRRHPSGGLERELGDDGLKRPREEADDARELDVVA